MCEMSYVRINVVAASALLLVPRAHEPVLVLFPFPVMCCILPFLVKRDEMKSLLEVVDDTCEARG